MARHVVMGVDLSLRGLGVVAVPSSWDLDFRNVAGATFGEPLPKTASDAERIARLHKLSAGVVQFARDFSVTDVFVESYAFDQRTAAHSLGEIGGVVRCALARELGLFARTAPIATARKLFLGKLPRRDVKAIVLATVRSLGTRFDTDDECEAWVVANYGLSELGYYAVMARAA